MRPDRSSAAFAAAVAGLGITVAYTACAAVLAEALPQHPRVALVVAEVAALLVPTLLARRLLAAGRVLPREEPLLPGRWILPVLGTAVSGMVVAWAIGVPWLALLDATLGHSLDGWKRLVAAGWVAIASVSSPLGAVLVTALLGALPAACEEPLFRGLFQRGLALAMPPWAAILLAAAFFSVAHLDPFGLPGRLFLGVTLGIVYARTGSLLACGLVHAVNNVLAVALVYSGGLQVDAASFFDDPLKRSLDGSGRAAFWLLAAGAAAAWGRSLVALSRATRPRADAPAAAEPGGLAP